MTVAEAPATFHARFVELFNGEFPRLYRYLDRLTGEPDLAADLAQEAFVRLYLRGSLPDLPGAWLITVAMNRLRNEQSTRKRRGRLLTLERAAAAHSDPPASPEQAALAADQRLRVRQALDLLPARERQLLLLRAEGYGHAELAAALQLNPASVGTLLARARAAFRRHYEGIADES